MPKVDVYDGTIENVKVSGEIKANGSYMNICMILMVINTVISGA